jgi:hypothetical protein
MANGDISFWAKVLGLGSSAIAAPVAILKATTVSKNDCEKTRRRCVDSVHAEIKAMRKEMSETNSKQTAWIMAIANKVDVKNEDVREL